MDDGTGPNDTKGDYYAPRSERFDVVMLKDGVAQHLAKVADIKRVSVVARDASSARSAAEVVAEEKAGYSTIHVMNPGGRSETEAAAIRREHEEAYPPTDRTKV